MGGHFRLLFVSSAARQQAGLPVHQAAEQAGERTFSFNVSPYTQEELTAKRHSYELQPCGSTVVCLDYVQNGIGSNSCGPELSEQYRLDAEQFNFEIKMIIK